MTKGSFDGGLRLIIVLGVGASGLACAPLLGGLDEGHSSDASAAGEAGALVTPATSTTAGRCPPWLGGFRYRQPVPIDHAAALPDQQFAFSLGSRRLINSGKLRVGAADLRITGADGTTILPHWIEGATTGDSLVIWTRLDIPEGPTNLFAYYGADTAPDVGPRAPVFVEDVFKNADFESGTAPWTVTAPTHGGTAIFNVVGGRARFEISADRPAGGGTPVANPTAAGLCQFVEFPAGSSYRLVLDIDTRHAGGGVPAVWADGVSSAPISEKVLAVGPRRAVESAPIVAGRHQVCLGGILDAWGQLSTSFDNLRVVRYAARPPRARLAGPEEANPCPAR